MSGGTFASWEAANDTKAGGHPKTFQPGHVTPGQQHTTAPSWLARRPGSVEWMHMRRVHDACIASATADYKLLCACLPASLDHNAELIAGMRQTVGLPPGVDKASFGAQPCAGWGAAAQAAREAFIDVGRMSQERCPATLGSLEYLQQDPFAGKQVPFVPLRSSSRWGLLPSAPSTPRPLAFPHQQPANLPAPLPLPPPAGAALDHRCVLLARKFSQPAAKWVERVYRSCTAGLGVLPCDPVLTDADNHWWA